MALTSGAYYYEVEVVSGGRASIGWADSEFNGSSDHGRGVGDDNHSWGWNGSDLKATTAASSTKFGFEWSAGDVVGCLVQFDEGTFSYSLNGSFDEPMGKAFDFKLTNKDGIFPCVSFDASFRFRINYGAISFRNPLPAKSRSVHSVVW